VNVSDPASNNATCPDVLNGQLLCQSIRSTAGAKKGLSTSLGAFFINEQTIDILSLNLPSDGMTKWTTDASGRVVSGLGTDGTITTFTYR
jgi:hypothetical protein